MNKYRFSYHTGEMGGVVLASNKEEAVSKVIGYLIETMPRESMESLCRDMIEYEDALQVWPWTHDDYFNANHPDVINCYGY